MLSCLKPTYISNYIGAVKVKQFTTAMVIMGAGRLLDKLKCEYSICPNIMCNS